MSPTIKQKKAIQKIVENHGNVSKAMREVGYEYKTAKNPKNLTESKGYKEVAEPYLKRLREERDRAIDAAKIKDLDKVGYAKIIEAVAKMDKTIQLLSGEDTERGSLTIKWK